MATNNLYLARLVTSVALTFQFLSGPSEAIMAGSPPDSPLARVDANTTSSLWAGVGSVKVNGSPYSGVAIGRYYVLTAGHVVKGAAIANVSFVLNYGANSSHTIPAAATFVHPNFISFGNPNVNNDIAIIQLASPIPEGVPIYLLNTTPIAPGTSLTFVGYGASGKGSAGITVGGTESVKRVGRNQADQFLVDDGGTGKNEVFYFDFDGNGATNFMGGVGLGNTNETTLASGDSGSPSFVQRNGQWFVAGINTFVATFPGGPTNAGTFGTGGGGQLVDAYVDWITAIVPSATSSTDIPTLPEWAAIALAIILIVQSLRRQRDA